VPVVADTHSLQNGRSETSRWFMGIARANVTRVRRGETAQGFYVLGADGAFFGYQNTRSVDHVLKLMDRGLAGWAKDDPEPVVIEPEVATASFCRTPPETTSVVRVFTRIRPLPDGAPRANGYLGRDFLWVTAGDVRAIMDTAADEFELPASLTARICRFHLVDNVRGEPPFWRSSEVKRAAFRVRRLRDAEDTAGAASQTWRYTLEGRFAMATKDAARGIEGSLQGALELDPTERRVTRFRGFVRAQAWGRGRWTPGPPEGRFPLVIAFVEADDPVARQVPPQAVGCGERYVDVEPGSTAERTRRR
jgi:hypothetical protein